VSDVRNTLLTGLAAMAVAGAIAAPAQAQLVATQSPQIDAGTCTVRSSHDEGRRFTYANCAITVKNVPVGQSVKVRYTSNLKTFTPHAEFGRWRHAGGVITAANPGGMPGQTAGTASDVTVGLQLAFPGKTVAQVKRNLKVTVASATKGAVVTDASATVSH
jgi:hypothetical protein